MSAENGVLTYRRAVGSVRVVIADGTTNFAHGYPCFAVSIAVLYRGRPLAATVVSGPLHVAWFFLRKCRHATTDDCHLEEPH